MATPSRVTAEDLHAVSAGVTDLVGEIRRLADKHTDVSADLKGVSTRLETLTTSIQRLETQQQAGTFSRLMVTFEKAPPSVGVALASVIILLVLLLFHIDPVAMVAAYGHSKGTP